MAGAAGLHLALSSMGLPSWECPFFKVTGVPCPGCGLTRATILLAKGDLLASIKFHAFAPIFIFMVATLVLGTLLPKSLTRSLIDKTEVLERQTGFTIIILTGLILYWLARLLLFPTDFVRLLRG